MFGKRARDTTSDGGETRTDSFQTEINLAGMTGFFYDRATAEDAGWVYGDDGRAT